MGTEFIRQILHKAALKEQVQIVAKKLGVVDSVITDSLKGRIKTVDRLFDIADACNMKFILSEKNPGKEIADSSTQEDVIQSHEGGEDVEKDKVIQGLRGIIREQQNTIDAFLDEQKESTQSIKS